MYFLEIWIGRGKKVAWRGRRGIQRAVVYDEIRATITDLLVNHGLSLKVQPNLFMHCSSVAPILIIYLATEDTCVPQLLHYILLYSTLCVYCFVYFM